MLPTEQVKLFIQKHHLFSLKDRILVAVSGGKDSVLLVHTLNALKVSFGIAHCNFQLRGQESEGDEAFVRNLAETLKIPFFCTRFETQKQAEIRGISIQMAARELRYAWFEELLKNQDYKHVALAHHQNDVVETVLLNLVRGTGIAGLHGILPKRGTLVRPLLCLTRSEIDNYIETESLRFREDSSNASDKYARNSVRRHVVPKLKELNPNLEKTFITNAERFSELEVLLELRVAELRNQWLTDAEQVRVPIEEIKKVQPLRLLLFHLFKEYNFVEGVVEDLVRALAGQPGKVFESSTHVILLDRHELIVTERTAGRQAITVFHEKDAEVEWNSKKFRIRSSAASFEPMNKSQSYAYLDLALVSFPIRIRSWKEGDFFQPFGMDGKKKLSDFFIGLKIPLVNKNNIAIFEDASGNIIWVGGYRIDDRFKVTSRTKKVLILELLR